MSIAAASAAVSTAAESAVAVITPTASTLIDASFAVLMTTVCAASSSPRSMNVVFSLPAANVGAAAATVTPSTMTSRVVAPLLVPMMSSPVPVNEYVIAAPLAVLFDAVRCHSNMPCPLTWLQLRVERRAPRTERSSQLVWCMPSMIDGVVRRVAGHGLDLEVVELHEAEARTQLDPARGLRCGIRVRRDLHAVDERRVDVAGDLHRDVVPDARAGLEGDGRGAGDAAARQRRAVAHERPGARRVDPAARRPRRSGRWPCRPAHGRRWSRTALRSPRRARRPRRCSSPSARRRSWSWGRRRSTRRRPCRGRPADAGRGRARHPCVATDSNAPFVSFV